jgi:hypothetical protein
MQRLLEFAVMVLAPLLLAVVIYRFAPSKAAVTGPFKGVSLNLQGAFAGCFAFMLLIFSFHDKLFPPPPPPLPPKYEVWSVDGKIVYDGDDPAKVAGQTTIYMDPPVVTVQKDGTFHAEFPTKPGYGGSNVDFPVMYIDLNDQRHDPVPLYLDGKPRPYETNQYTVHIDQQAKEIEVEKPVVLKKKAAPSATSAPYNASNAAPAQPAQEHQP